jgi:hypothetical protein
MSKTREFYLNNAGDDDVSVAELAGAIIAGVVSLDELRYPLVPFNKWEAIQKHIQSNNHQKESPSIMPLQSHEYYLENVESTEAKELAEAILAKIISFEDLQDTMLFSVSEQRKVRDILDSKSLVESTINNGSIPELESLLNRKSLSTDDKIRIEQRIIALQGEEEASAFNSATTVIKCEDFKKKYPNSKQIHLINDKINSFKIIEVNERKKLVDEILKNIHSKDTQDIVNEYGDDMLREICAAVELPYDKVRNIDKPRLYTTGLKPEKLNDIPENYTDVFFWGSPGCGKSCALAAIFKTIHSDTKYTMLDPSKHVKIYGRPYRESLTDIFNTDGIGYLPNRTPIDDTHYMNFVLKDENSKTSKKINISFFEVSGELFKYIRQLEEPDDSLDPQIKLEIEKPLNLLNLVLKSRNPKIHFFFIDYQKQMLDRDNSQLNYLNAAATYFNNNNDIFEKNTLAIHIVITKADLLPGDNKMEEAKKFYNETFGNFDRTIKERKSDNNIKTYTHVFPFSIGKVYFKSLCYLDTKDSKKIVDTLLGQIKTYDHFWRRVQKIFNKKN